MSRMVLWVVAALASVTGAAVYTGTPEYGVGGANRATIVIDFDAEEAFLFEYTWDGEASGWDALRAIDAAGDLDVLYQEYGWGVWVQGFEYPGATAFDYGEDNVGWAYFVSEDNEDWQAASAGATERLLADGSWDAWVWTNYSADWSQAYRQPGEMPIPEPGMLALLGLGAVWLRRR